jgi:hypothetical protein
VRILDPQQFDEGARIASRILPAAAPSLYSEPGTVQIHHLDLPPLRNRCFGSCDVLGADDESCPVENHSVHSCLSGKSAQAVSIGLDLVSVDRTIDDRDVDPNLPAAEAEFLKERDVRLVFVTFAQTFQ